MMRNIKALSHQWYALKWPLETFDTCRHLTAMQQRSGNGPTQQNHTMQFPLLNYGLQWKL